MLLAQVLAQALSQAWGGGSVGAMKLLAQLAFALFLHAQVPPPPPSPPPPTAILAIGDSITSGLNANTPWLTLVADRMPGVPMFNAGAPSATMLTTGALPYITTTPWQDAQAFLQVHPDATVFIMLGTNDSVDAAWSVAAFKASYEGMLAALPTTAKAILLSPIALHQDHPAYTVLRDEVRPAVLAVAAAHQLPHHDFFDAFYGNDFLYTADQVHPNDTGQAWIGRDNFDLLGGAL